MRVDALSKLCPAFLQGGSSEFITAIASSFFPKGAPNENVAYAKNYVSCITIVAS